MLFFIFYYISGFLRKTKRLTKCPSCFGVYLINCKSPGRFLQIYVAFLKTWTLQSLHYIIVLQYIICQIWFILSSIKLKYDNKIYFPEIHMNFTCFQCKLSYNDYINHSDAPVYATAMTTMGQFNEWHFPLLLCMLHTCQNICGKSRELKHWRKKNYHPYTTSA